MPHDHSPSRYGASWTRNELILAFELYCRIPFGKTKANNPEIKQLAEILNRTPASVARKLGNFGSFDPELQKQQVTGLTHASKLDKEIWIEFNSDWSRLVWEASQLRNSPSRPAREMSECEFAPPRGRSEKEVVRKARVHQTFFREAILSSYEDTCCVTGLTIKECLIASHIVPWSVSERLRADPQNGLCLSATFDRLFDQGLMTLSDTFEVVLSSRLRETEDKLVDEIICRYHGAPIRLPRRFFPQQDCLQWHRTHIFQN